MSTASSSPNVTLITVDCWRADSVQNMPALQALGQPWFRRTVLCQGGSTNSAFPPLLASQYSMAVYDGQGRLKPSVVSLPGVLREHGYRTGAFIGCNPWLEKWRGHFDQFWNGGVSGEAAAAPTRGWPLVRHARHLLRLAALRTAVPASEVLARGWDWYENCDGPKFLWMHLMDAHEPYHPGLRRGVRAGLLRSYRALLAQAWHNRRGGELSDSQRRQLRRLYGECIGGIDKALGRFLPRTPEGDVALVTGDHGEEFDHGVFTHARLYEESLCVPFWMRWPVGGGHPPAFASDDLRHLDVAPALLAALGVPLPDSWRGDPAASQPVSLATNGSARLGRFFVSLRTPEWKYIRVHRLSDMEVLDHELYSVPRDPGETDDLADLPEHAETRSRLEQTLERGLGANGIDLSSRIEDKPGVAGVEQHLRDLGYL